MGGTHQSHVYNKTDEEVYVVLKAPGGDSSYFLQPGEVHNFPTGKGYVTFSVYEKANDGTFYSTATVSRTDESDRSMIIMKDKRIKIVPSVYGNVYEQDTNLR